MKVYRKVLKPSLDFIIALFVLLVLSPLLIMITLWLAIVNDGMPFFIQARPGKDGHIFKLVKFKTMNDLRDREGELLPDKDRLTAIGRLVRRTSIDELPQLLNVLKGDMSIVGPRPLLVQYLPLYNTFQFRRHEVKPGITGWAQVNGRNNLSWPDRFGFDVWYVDNQSFILDIKILWLTIIKTVSAADINQSGQSTVEYFKGND